MATVASIEKIVQEMRVNRNDVRFSECLKVCIYYFSKYRINGSHYIFKTPWEGEPRINIQDRKGYVAPYQVKQVLEAVDMMEGDKNV